MSVNKTDVVGEYLHEVGLRLSGLPVLQRRELLSDLATHIDAARERGAYSEGEMIEVLERLGSPEVVAAAAYAEAGPPLLMAPPEPPPAAPESRANIWPWVIAGAVGLFVVFLLGIAGLLFMAQASSTPAPAVGEQRYEPDGPNIYAPDAPAPAEPEAVPIDPRPTE